MILDKNNSSYENIRGRPLLLPDSVHSVYKKIVLWDIWGRLVFSLMNFCRFQKPNGFSDSNVHWVAVRSMIHDIITEVGLPYVFFMCSVCPGDGEVVWGRKKWELTEILDGLFTTVGSLRKRALSWVRYNKVYLGEEPGTAWFLFLAEYWVPNKTISHPEHLSYPNKTMQHIVVPCQNQAPPHTPAQNLHSDTSDWKTSVWKLYFRRDFHSSNSGMSFASATQLASSVLTSKYLF